jgi:hypothetical protein
MKTRNLQFCKNYTQIKAESKRLDAEIGQYKTISRTCNFVTISFDLSTSST